MFWANDEPSTDGNSSDSMPQDMSFLNVTKRLFLLSCNDVFQSPLQLPIATSSETPFPRSITTAATRPQETANDNNYELPSCSSSKKNTISQPGYAYIFNNDTFDLPGYSDREGSEADVKKLLKVFKKFKLKVDLIQNATVNKIRETVDRIVQTDFSSISCVVIVILSHGTRHEEVVARDEMFNINDDILFPILGNRTLSDKPKIMFIQACKGNRSVGGLEADSVPPNGPPSEIFKCYSTFEGYLSFRNPQTGSIFIQTLCKVLEEHGATKHIAKIMDMVKLQVKEETKSMGRYQQIPSSWDSLTMEYIFGDYV